MPPGGRKQRSSGKRARPRAAPEGPDRFHELDRLAIQVRAGAFRAESLYWNFLGQRWWRNYLHSHSFFEVCYAVSGQGTFCTDGRRLPVNEGELFIARPGDMHEIISSRKSTLGIYFWAFTLVNVGATENQRDAEVSVTRLLEAFTLSERRVSKMQSTTTRTLKLLVDEICKRDAGYTIAINGLALNLLLETARCVAEGAIPAEAGEPAAHSDTEATVKTAMRYLRDNLARPIEVRDVAVQVHLSERHLSRLFHEVAGVSVLDFLTNIRIELASQLLLDKEIPIKQVARMVGYPDRHYFTTLFGRRTGMTPAVFRQSGGTKYLDADHPTQEAATRTA
jgi:AraC-like DNA-binding protein/mannose-6-phosphate isomerase-like protein (cupin superfamily)